MRLESPAAYVTAIKTTIPSGMAEDTPAALTVEEKEELERLKGLAKRTPSEKRKLKKLKQKVKAVPPTAEKTPPTKEDATPKKEDGGKTETTTGSDEESDLGSEANLLCLSWSPHVWVMGFLAMFGLLFLIALRYRKRRPSMLPPRRKASVRWLLLIIVVVKRRRPRNVATKVMIVVAVPPVLDHPPEAEAVPRSERRLLRMTAKIRDC